MKTRCTAKAASPKVAILRGQRKMPALARAEKLGLDARRAGMDWTGIREVLAKVREELAEIETALDEGDLAAVAEELGDLMLAIANAPRFIGHRADRVLARACEKFVVRFNEAARIAAARGRRLKSMRPDELESLWQAAKRNLYG
jgi:nucleoside triphosphate diphosphatase